MRKFIIGLSILFYAVSGIVTIKALINPASDNSYQNNRKDKQLTKSQVDNQALVKELQHKISLLEDNLSNKVREPHSPGDNKDSQNKGRALATLSGDTFSSGQVIVNENSINVIKALSHDILASPEYKVIIEGHTDNMPIRPSLEKQYSDNMDLSFLRAKAVAQILIDQGITKDRISVIGYGDTRPIDSNETAEGKAKNRRVEVKLIPKNTGL